MVAPYVIDILFAAILLICVIVAWCRGFVKTIVSFFGFIAAAVIAMLTCTRVADYLYHTVVEQPLYDSIYKKVLTLVPTGEIINSVDNIGEVLPAWVRALFDVAASEASERIGETLTGTAEMVSHTLLDTLVAPLVLALMGLVLFFVLFGLLMVIVNILVAVLGKVFELPVLNGINRLLGGVVGVVNGILVCMIAAALLSLYAAVTADASSWVNTQTLQTTTLASFFIRNNPILPMIL